MSPCVAVFCSVLQRVAACRSVFQCIVVCCYVLQCVAVRCSVLQCIALCCRVLEVLHWLVVYCSVWLAGTRLSCHKYELVHMLPYLALCCSVSQCVTVCWSCNTWMSHVTCMNESCHASEWVVSHVWMIHVRHRMRYVTEMNESCHVSHIRHMQESRHEYDWVMS